MNIYEITYVTKLEIDDVVKNIESKNGKILNTKNIGRKKFAYPIKKETAGFYSTLVFELEGSQVNQLDSELRINANVLRHLIVSYNKDFSAVQIKEILNSFSDAPQSKPVKDDAKEKNKIDLKEVVASESIKTDEKDTKEKKEKQVKAKSKTVKNEEEISEKTDVVSITEESVSDEVDKKSAKDAQDKKQKVKDALKKPKKEAVSEDERLAKLEEKLDQLLKD
jgi:small subunit ribosomal protein S6